MTDSTVQKNTALVTGASSGIGLAIARELAKRGYPLLLVSNQEDQLAQAARELEEKFQVKASIFCVDLAQEDSAQKLFDYCADKKFVIEILVNNAGIFFFKYVAETPPDLIDKIVYLHILTPAKLTQLFAQAMIADNRKGHILNMASIASRMMMPGIALYSATKSFLRCFSRSMRNEVFDKNVFITTISPGAVATNLYNLPPRYLKFGVRLGIILPVERLAAAAVKKMFKRRAEHIPSGFINRFFIFIVRIMPEKLVRLIKRKIHV